MQHTNPQPNCVHENCRRRTRDHVTFLCCLHQPAVIEKRRIYDRELKRKKSESKPKQLPKICKYYTCNRSVRNEYCGQHNPSTMAKKRESNKQFYKNTEREIIPDELMQLSLKAMDQLDTHKTITDYEDDPNFAFLWK